MLKFKITEEQIEIMRPFIDNVDEIIKLSLNDFLTELNYAIVGELGYNYESTESSDKLQKLYNDILNQN